MKALGLALLISAAALAQAVLKPGAAVTGIAGPHSASYVIELGAGEAVWLTLSQNGVDLSTRVIPPAGGPVTFDAFETGPEPVTIEAVSAGVHRIEVGCPRTCPSTGFVLRVGEIHRAGPDDRERAEAARLCAVARPLVNATTKAESGIEKALSAAAIFRGLGEPVHEASALSIAGNGYYSQNDMGEAEKLFRRALDLCRGADPVAAADILTNIGVCRSDQGFPDEALTYYLQAEDNWRRMTERTFGEAETLSNIGVLLCQMGECNKAIEYYREALPILKKYNQPSKTATALQNIGVAYGFLGDNNSASEYIEAALPLFRSDAESGTELVRPLTNLALVRVEQRRYEQALALEREALALAGESDKSRADVLTDVCKVETLLGRAIEAVDGCREAVALYGKIGERRGEGAALHNLGVALSMLHRWDDAGEAFEKALIIRRASKVPSGIVDTLTRLAQVQAEKGRLESGLELAAEAVNVTESLRARVIAERLRTSYFAAKQSSYETYIDILMRLDAGKPGVGYDARALEVAERRRARTLIDLLGEPRSDVRISAAEDLMRERAQLVRRLNYYQRAAPQEIDGALRELELVEAKLRERDPRTAELFTSTPPDLAAIRAQLAPSDALVEYSLGQNRSYAWVLTTAGLSSYVLPSRERVERVASDVIGLATAVRRRSADSAMEARFQRALAVFEHELFAPLRTAVGQRRVVLVADGALQLVPFAALPGMRNEVVEAPSAWTIAKKREASTPVRKAGVVAIFADPVFDAGDPRVDSRSMRPPATTDPFPRLVFSREEASAIARFAPMADCRTLFDFDASKKSFLDTRTAGYRYLHVSSHAIVDTDRPELSSIVLSQVDRSGASVDGRVHIYDLYGFRTSADLVTLSACRTGSGKPTNGEGLIGLTRAFLFAGARSVLVTLWPVEDEGTAAFMGVFYENLLAKKMAPVAALAATQRTMRNGARWQDPYYWAGFVLHGDWR
jgi:CHAT domain-containing protein/Tfp pilus assembly protein PilF